MFTWYYCVILISLMQLTSMVAIGGYMHRAVAHGLVKFNPVLETFFRCWLWFIGMWWPNSFKIWAATHRIHHRYPDTEIDKHSPHFRKSLDILFDGGAPGEVYYISQEEVDKYAPDVVQYNDKLEQFFCDYRKLGVYTIYILFFVLFGLGGLVVCFFYYPLLRFIGRIHNIVGHLDWGYRNRPAKATDRSQNQWPWLFLWCGEELHANHHDNPGNIKCSEKWWEFDAVYTVIKSLEFFKLAEIVKK